MKVWGHHGHSMLGETILQLFLSHKLWHNVCNNNVTSALFLNEKLCEFLLCLSCPCSSPCPQVILYEKECYACPDIKRKYV